MELLIAGIWLTCAVLCAIVAGSKNRSTGGWFMIGLLTGVLGLIAAAGVPPLPEKPQVAPDEEQPREIVLGGASWPFVVFTIVILGIALTILMA